VVELFWTFLKELMKFTGFLGIFRLKKLHLTCSVVKKLGIFGGSIDTKNKFFSNTLSVLE
jgi:hypothetical protein